MKRPFSILIVSASATLVAGALAPAIGQVPGAPATVVDAEFPTRIEKYRVTDFGKSASARDDRTFKAKFRVNERTGNCCENYLTASKNGRLLDLGGRYVNFTDDSGSSWKSVQPIEPLINGEGTLAMAPNGDVVAIEWDPYSGDHLLSYKYDAESESWEWLEAPLHTPFYDRPWLSVVPGPFEVATGTVPYVAFVDGYPHTGALLMSTDGVSWFGASSPYVDEQLEDPVESWIKTKRDPALDWIQPNSNSPVVPLGGGRALASPDFFGSSWSILNPDTLRWAPFSLPNGDELSGRLLVDSKGRIHNLKAAGPHFEYRISGDGGRSWTSQLVTLPDGITNTGGLQFDFRVNAKVGIAAVAMHVHKTKTATDQDIVYTLDITGETARVKRLYQIGLGDVDAKSGIGQDTRFDFETVAILPDGRIAVSFLDTTTAGIYHLAEPVKERMGPALAIEL